MKLTARGKGLRAGVWATVIAGAMALLMAISLPGWVGLVWAGSDGDLVLGSFISNGSCTPVTTNCAGGVTGMTSHGAGLVVRADDGDALAGTTLSGDTGVTGTSSGTGGSGIGVSGQGPNIGVDAQGHVG